MIFWVWVILTGLAYVIARWRIGNHAEMRRYFKTPPGRQALKGIILFTQGPVWVLLLLALLCKPAHAEVKWLQFAEIYAGADYVTNGPSPQCWPNWANDSGGADDRITSNGGARLNILTAFAGRLALNAKYTHHSCALNRDRILYDGVGPELVVRLW